MAKGSLDERKLQAELRIELARRVATREVSDKVVQSVTKQLADLQGRIREPIRGMRICPRGICLDYFVEPGDAADRLRDVLDMEPRLRDLRVFPWGIIETDLLQIVVEHQFDELAPLVGDVPTSVGTPGTAVGPQTQTPGF